MTVVCMEGQSDGGDAAAGGGCSGLTMQRRAMRPVAAREPRPEGREGLSGTTEVDNGVHLGEGGGGLLVLMSSKWLTVFTESVEIPECCMQIVREQWKGDTSHSFIDKDTHVIAMPFQSWATSCKKR